MDKKLRRAQRDGELFRFIIFYFDHVKELDTNYGHPQGDIALKVTGGVLLKIFRVASERFSVVVNTHTQASMLDFAKIIRMTIEGLTIPHVYS
jgi:PleD family two-component response regulator